MVDFVNIVLKVYIFIDCVRMVLIYMKIPTNVFILLID